MDEAEAYDGGADEAEQAEFDESAEGSVAVDVEGEPVEDPWMVPSVFEEKDGKLMASVYDVVKDETSTVEMLAHDPEMQAKVMALEIGSPPIVNQKPGTNLAGEPVTFQMTYARTESGIIATPGEIPGHPESHIDDGEFIGPELPPSEFTPQPVALTTLRPKPAAPEIGFQPEGSSVPEDKPKLVTRKNWWEQELGFAPKVPEVQKEPVGLLDFLELATISDETDSDATEETSPATETFAEIFDKVVEYDQPKVEHADKIEEPKQQETVPEKTTQELMEETPSEPAEQPQTEVVMAVFTEPLSEPQGPDEPDGGITTEHS